MGWASSPPLWLINGQSRDGLEAHPTGDNSRPRKDGVDNGIDIGTRVDPREYKLYLLLGVVALFTQSDQCRDGFDPSLGQCRMLDEARGLWRCRIKDRIASEPLDLAGELGDDCLGGAFADFGELDEGFGVFIHDRGGDISRRLNHRAEGLLRAYTLDSGENLEKAAIRDARESDEPGDETGALPLRFEIKVGVQGDLGADLRLEFSRKVSWDQHFDRHFRRCAYDGSRDGALGDGFKICGESGEHMNRGYPDLCAQIALSA